MYVADKTLVHNIADQPAVDCVVDAVVDTYGAQQYIGASVGTLRNWRSQGRGPRYIRYGRAIRYRVSDLNKYVEAHMVGGRR